MTGGVTGDRARPSLQQVIRGRRRARFVGRRAELALFDSNFDFPPEDDRHRFVFHVRGTAGVGKTSLVRELQDTARGRGALTAHVDDSVNSVPDAMAAISAQAGRDGRPLKAFDRMMSTYRQRRHEAASVVDDPEQALTAGGPSLSHAIAARAGLVGLSLIPGVGALAGAVDPARLAEGTERVRAALSARFRQDDVQLVMDPLPVLTPLLFAELERAAADGAPWITLFFDTYERTGAFLDPWLCALFGTERYGELPAGLIVTTAGRRPLDRVRWADSLDLVAEMSLEPFTEAEARELLSAKGVVDEPVVREVLRLSGRLPVLVSTLAENPGTAAGAVDDPSATAVERFLQGEQDPVRRAAALDGALPRRLNEDVFAASVPDGVPDGAAELFAWLRSMPFVDERAGRVVYHDVVRAPMLRLRRAGSPQRWIAGHERLATAFARWCATAAAGVDPQRLWAAEAWRELRLEETYHRLCAQPRIALPGALRDGIGACREGTAAARAWARALAQAGEDTDSEPLRMWGRDALAALADERRLGVDLLGLLLARADLDTAGRVEALVVRARDLHNAGEYEAALADSLRALELDPASAAALHGRGRTHRRLGDLDAALCDLDRALELDPGFAWTLAERGEVHRLAGRYEEAVADLDGAVGGGLDHHWPLASRGHALLLLGRTDEALRDLDRALELRPAYVWALLRRARARTRRGDFAGALADLSRAGGLAPDNPWIAGERGDAYRFAGRFEEAVAEYTRALELDPAYAWALGSRAMALEASGRPAEALRDLDRALELEPDYVWARLRRAEVCERLGDRAGARADLDRAAATANGREAWELAASGAAHALAGRHEEALADLDRALRLAPGHRPALWARAGTNLALGRTEQGLADLAELARLSRSGSGGTGGAYRSVDLSRWGGGMRGDSAGP
ncbi:tetratricopeptide repeat protein [Streptomyces sp. NPDC002889]|uniref:tetratricopeptide repeat protein n=1 Tax=Streptomyces sp. NPDC002889 TaxID=3364669 RepID=UPI00369475AE